jgi:hypothetical protein
MLAIVPGGQCEIDIFDFTSKDTWKPPRSPGVRLHKLGVTSVAKSTDIFKSYAEIMAFLGHANRTVNVLKIDIEGSEFDVLPEVAAMPIDRRPQQILVEMHLSGGIHLQVRESDDVLLRLREAGYVMTHTEVNYFGALSFNEYSFLQLASRTTTDVE